MTFENCTIKGRYTCYGTKTVFKNCTFIQDVYDYNVWTWGCDEVEFIGCEFHGQGKALKAYHAGANSTTVTVTGCKFYSDGTHVGADKPAIAVNTDNPEGHITVIVSDCEQTGFVANGDTAMTNFYNSSELIGTEKTNTTLILNGTQVYPVS